MSKLPFELKENNAITLIRKTRSVCPVCSCEMPAAFIRENDVVFLKKTCPEHGDVSSRITSMADAFADLSQAYFTIVPQGLPLKILELSMTPKCSMQCPICSVMESIGKQTQELSVDDVARIVDEHPGKEVILWGMESTENESLKEILQMLRLKKRHPFLFTNGKKIADLSYLRDLKRSGLAHVYLQFDGFDDRIYHVLRNESLLENKLKGLENLKKLGIPTTLNVTLAKHVNEGQIAKIIDYAIANSDFIRQIGFLPLIKVGGADTYRDEIVPEFHEFLAIIEKQTGGRISLGDLHAFQKLMYVVYRFTRFRRCFWFTFYILFKRKDQAGYLTIGEILNLKMIEKIIDSYVIAKRKKGSLMSDILLIGRLIPHLVTKKTWPLLFSGFKFFFFGKKLEDARSHRDMVFITCTDFCDLYKMDLDMAAQYCEELLAIKSKEGVINYEPTYRMMIKGSCRRKTE